MKPLVANGFSVFDFNHMDNAGASLIYASRSAVSRRPGWFAGERGMKSSEAFAIIFCLTLPDRRGTAHPGPRPRTAYRPALPEPIGCPK